MNGINGFYFVGVSYLDGTIVRDSRIYKTLNNAVRRAKRLFHSSAFVCDVEIYRETGREIDIVYTPNEDELNS